MRELTSEARARASLRRHNRVLAELVATRTELVSAMLHELRTPLASTLAMVEMLPEGTGDPRLDEALELIARNVRRIAGVTEQIATISGMENGTLPIERREFDLAALLAEHGFAVAAGAGTIVGDRERLGQVFGRLVDAVGALGGPPSRGEASADGDHWRIALRLPPDLVTDRLFTGANATALMFARAVVGRHGGTVGVESASLVVSLPRSARPPG
ncbi:sensor histidine kinase [Actinoplanes sp. NPDC051513]|uniref:sensor histidine kinase n=1 Tax=Actinoplanes sp. NPDC051513 TaxID=3363908 RepID=UPI0037A22E0E